MATLVLGAVGKLVAGPVGGAIGALAGNQIDSLIFSSGGKREGPRVKDLAITTSSYGQPIGRQFGSMRTAGVIIWSTDLAESRETSGGGKGKPKVTSFSYSASFAVALSSRPIHALGRIWADGRLLRGSAGDLKAAGTLRLHLGHGDQGPDPLIAAAEGGQTPAFRDCAYVVFEDLQLGEFGNRIPALTFEVIADHQPVVMLGRIAPMALTLPGSDQVPHMRGFTDEGGPVLDSLEAISRAYLLTSVTDGANVAVNLVESIPSALPQLPGSLADNSPDGASSGEQVQFKRAAAIAPSPVAMRYYDRDRDYQPGVQRAIGQPSTGREVMFDLPAALEASGARQVVNRNAQGRRWQIETLKWTIAELDPAFGPGAKVRVPKHAGTWIVASWEWSETGVELMLERLSPLLTALTPSEPGRINPPDDLPTLPTILRAIELPWDGSGSQNTPVFRAAVSASAAHWSGAGLYVEQLDGLVPLNEFANKRSIIGVLAAPLAASPSTMVEPNSALEIELAGDGFVLGVTTVSGLASGVNRMLVGGEIIQFLDAEQFGPRLWRVSGLLRGRGGTEAAAALGHPAGSDVIVIDDTLIALDPSQIAETGATRLAAIGLADDIPAFATLDADGHSRQPPPPVHARRVIAANGNWQLCWTRRARGQWRWPDFIETPLIEEQESYQLGIGSIGQPLISWQVASPRFELEAGMIASLSQSAPQAPVWVRQLGTFGFSLPTLITNLI